MKLIRKRGDTSNIMQVFIQDSSSTTGAGLSGLAFNTASLIAYYHKDTDTTATVITLVTMTVGTFTSSGFAEIDATHMKGWYQFCPPDAALSTSGTPHSVAFHLGGASNMAPLPIEVQLIAADVEDTVRLGLTALPNAAAAAANGLMVLGTNATATSFTAGFTISNAGGDALTLTSSGSNGSGVNALGNGTGAGIKGTAGAIGNGFQLIGGATSGSGMKVSGTAGNAIALELVGQGSAAAFSSTGGATGAGFKIVGGGTSGDGIDITTTSGDGLSILPTAGNAIIATANGTSKHGAVITGGTAGTSDGIKAVAGTGGVDIRGAITGSITGNLSGSAGSVTGAVGSVTGAVGSVTGNVGGSVASVTGAVGSVTGNVGGNVTGSVGSVVGAVGSVTGNVGGSTASVTAPVSVANPAAIKKNVALAKFAFLMIDSADHVTPKTGLTVTAQRSLDGGAFAACANAVVELSSGWYNIDLAATDTNANVIAFKFTATGADATNILAAANAQ